MLSIHHIDHLYAKQSELPGGNWVDLLLCSKSMGEISITLYFEHPGHASTFHDLVNEHQKLTSINDHIVAADATEKFAE